MNKYQKEDQLSYCLGMSLTIEALKHKASFVSEVILSSKASKNNQLDLLLDLCNKHNISCHEDDILISKLSNKENCYCIGIFNKFYPELEGDNHVVLYGFKDYGDLGTTIRSAISFNFKDIVLVNSDLDYFDPRCVRASMGSIFLANIKKYDSLSEYLKDYNNTLYPFTSSGNTELKQIRFQNPFSIIITQDYKELDDKFIDSYYISHDKLDEISLSIRSSIIFSQCFYQISNDKSI